MTEERTPEDQVAERLKDGFDAILNEACNSIARGNGPTQALDVAFCKARKEICDQIASRPPA